MAVNFLTLNALSLPDSEKLSGGMDLPTDVQVEWFDEHNQKRSSPNLLHRPSLRLLDCCKGIDGSHDLISRVLEGFQSHEPELAEEGEGGTYFMKNKRGKRIAVFKPFDEQPHCENNPKSKDSEILLPEAFEGIKTDEGPKNELAAYMLDRHHFADVPLTVLVECTHHIFSRKIKNKESKGKEVASSDGKFYQTKFGSLQRYVDFDVQSWDMGASRFATREVHRIGILDIRLLNLDRHGGNILVVRQNPSNKLKRRSGDDFFSEDEDEDDRNSGSSNYHLVPIDHAFSLPSVINGTDLWFEWMNWSQANQPFSEESLHFIEDINLEEDIAKLVAIGIRKECIQTMILTTELLKIAALRLKMNLRQIARLICREGPNKPSLFERLGKQVFEEFSRLARDTPNAPEGKSADDLTRSVNDLQDLMDFVPVAQQTIETILPGQVTAAANRGSGKLRRNSSISNNLYLQQLVEDQLKITE